MLTLLNEIDANNIKASINLTVSEWSWIIAVLIMVVKSMRKHDENNKDADKMEDIITKLRARLHQDISTQY